MISLTCYKLWNYPKDHKSVSIHCLIIYNITFIAVPPPEPGKYNGFYLSFFIFYFNEMHISCQLARLWLHSSVRNKIMKLLHQLKIKSVIKAY